MGPCNVSYGYPYLINTFLSLIIVVHWVVLVHIVTLPEPMHINHGQLGGVVQKANGSLLNGQLFYGYIELYRA